MIIKATKKHLPQLTVLLAEMYAELFGADASEDVRDYAQTMLEHLASELDTVYIDSEFRGFFVVRDETERIAPTLRRYNGLRVYIQEAYRKGRLLT